MHDWESGDVQNTYGLGDYKAKFGTVRISCLLLEFTC